MQIAANEKKDVVFGTKAEMLESLSAHVKHAQILPLYYFSSLQWQRDPASVLAAIAKLPWAAAKLVVRSSATGEDGREASLAGHFNSVLGVQGEAELTRAISEVIASYQTADAQQVLVQPFLDDVSICGVAFSHDPNTNSPYVVINYDDASGSTESITSGKSTESKCFIWQRACPEFPDGFLGQVITLLAELESLIGSDFIDIEFALTTSGALYLFQARPLIMPRIPGFGLAAHQTIIQRIAEKLALCNRRHPYLYGEKTVYGVMPDWNPAEIVGVRPRPLALSLYRSVVTDSVWAYQRDNYGYHNLRSFPLLVDFEGLPYIDVRVSFNSFLPKGLPEELAERLVNYYIERLVKNPALHDKVEFDIIFSCYALDLEEHLATLGEYGFSKADQAMIASALTSLTNGIIHNKDGLWRKDLDKIHELERRQQLLFTSDLDPISKMYWILEDCKRYGTLPFAGLARAGFIAVRMLDSFVAKGIINQDEYARFFSSLSAISSHSKKDFEEKPRAEFLEKYGHLRPGTYDILSPRYDESPELYFDWTSARAATSAPKTEPFSLNIQQLRVIQEHIDRDNLDTNVLDMLEFIKVAIESREYSKFIFTKSLSYCLKLLGEYGAQYGFSLDDCSYLNVNVIETLYSTTNDPTELLSRVIKNGKERFAATQSITLPPLLCNPSDAWCFHFPETLPNFITQKSCTGPVVFSNVAPEKLKGGILFIPNADPGYDWIFSHDIAGFVTQFGGVNSHMAIRAGELGIPAVIGAGEIRYNQWSKARNLHIDASNKQVQIL